MKKILTSLLLIICLTLVGCNSNNSINNSTSSENTIVSDVEDKILKLYIDDINIDVTWENNASVAELKELAEDELTISMSMYGSFEQVGPIGKSITRDDKQTTTSAGDIVLYSGNQLVVFYGSNSWAYTRLGKINLNEKELKNLLSNGDVTITLSME